MKVNEVRLSGRAVRDAVRFGNGPYRFSLACGGGKKLGSEERWPVEFFDVCSWHDSAAVRKGQEVLICGRLHQNIWEKDGQKHSRVEILATQITKPEPPITPKYELPAHLPRERKVAEARPVTEQDPISDEDVPF